MKTKFFPIIIFTFFFTHTFCQDSIKVIILDSSQLQMSARHFGKQINGIKWTDKLGENIVITEETCIYKNQRYIHENDIINMGGFDAEIFAFHYIVKDGMQQTWRVYDFINDCEVDLDARFLKNTLKVTDLNNDGVGEVWIMYKKVCHREVSPWEMRIVMYEGKRKFVMHGFNKVKVAEKEYRGGQYRFNRNFRHASKQIKAFALNLWNKNIMQTSEQQNQE